MAKPERYDDLGSVNAVKLLPKIDSYNGYIQLYTELDSHIEEGDIVFITYSGDTNQLGVTDVLLDNYAYSILLNDYIYGGYTQGYTVIYVNKNFNTFAIDRSILTIPPSKKLYGHYVSRVSCLNITMDKASIDSTLFKNADINLDLGLNHVNWMQGVVLDGNIFNVELTNKYNINYLTLKLQYDETTNTYTKFSNLNNEYYGYSYFYDLDSSIKSCDIYSGNFFNCNIIGDPTVTGSCMNGYFDNCILTNYNINNGYFKDCVVNQSEWYYGIWDGGFFHLPVWRNGNFLNGVLGSLDYQVTWQDGYFTNGIFRGIYWQNGSFLGGLFEGTGRTDSGTGQQTNTIWENGKFLGGVMKNSMWDHTNWQDGKVIGGTLYNVVMNNGVIEGGTLYNTTAKNVTIEGGTFVGNYFSYTGLTGTYSTGYSHNYITDCLIYGGDFVSDLSGHNYIQDSTIYNGNQNSSEFYNNNIIEDGNFLNSYFYLPITVEGGTFDTCSFQKKLYNSSKATIRKRTLLDPVDHLVDRICLEFKNGHFFTQSNTGKTVTLQGFSTQELNGISLTIIGNNTYRDPSTFISGFVHPYVSGVTNDYIIVETGSTIYKSYMFGDSGIVTGDLYDLPVGNFILNEGTYKNSTFIGDVVVNSGVYNYSYMRSGVTFNNGVFNGSEFRSLSGQSDNNWYNGIFYNGIFGNNSFGASESATLIISDNFDQFRFGTSWDSPGTGTTGCKIEGIYPLVIKRNMMISDIQEGNLAAWSLNYLELSVSNLADENNNGWIADYDFAVLSAIESWNQVPHNYLPNLYDWKVRPYDMVFKISCPDQETLSLLSQLIEYRRKIEIVKYDENDFIGRIEEPCFSFSELFKMKYYVYDWKTYTNNSQYFIYIIFRFEDILTLYKYCTQSERDAFDMYYKNIWSVANTGYYTHPLPVKSISQYDLYKVGKFTLMDSGNITHESDWIYGTAPPPWWLDDNNIYNFEQIPNVIAVSTFSGNTTIKNNGNSVDSFSVSLTGLTDLMNCIKTYPTEYWKFIDGTPYANEPHVRTYYNWMYYHVYHKNDMRPDFPNQITGDTQLYYEITSGITGWTSTNYPLTSMTWSSFHGTNSGIGHYSGHTNIEPVLLKNTITSTIGKKYFVTVCAITYDFVDDHFHPGEVIPEFFDGQFLDKVSSEFYHNFPIEMKFSYLQSPDPIQIVTSTDVFIEKFEKEVTANSGFRIKMPLHWQGFITNIIIRESYTASELDSMYSGTTAGSSIIISDTGLSWYGVSLADQNEIYAGNNPLNGFSSPRTPAWVNPNIDSAYMYNFQDVALFEAYHKFVKAHSNSLSASRDDYSITENLINMRNLSKFDHYRLLNGNVTSLFNGSENSFKKTDFQHINSKYSTSVLNFNLDACLQIYSKNVTASEDDFKDNWYGGKFYYGDFQGKWRGGKWLGGLWHGWNSLTSGQTDSAVTALWAPTIVDVNSIENQSNYIKNYEYLKKKGVYYDITPWDDANKKYKEIINPVLKKNERKM